MYALLSVSFLLLMRAAGVIAIAAPSSPGQEGSVLERRAVAILTASQVAGFDPFTEFATAAYCPSILLQNWTCGGGLVFLA